MKVLVADDDPTLRMLMKEILQLTLNCEVVEAADGEEAWNLLDSGTKVDICIFDMRMPRLGGVDLVIRLRADDRFCQQKIMVCSGVNERAPILEAVSAGIDGYLIKPFVGETLHSQIRKLMDKPLAPPPPKALTPVEDILKRLGTKRQTYLRLLKTFTSDVADTVGLLRGNWTTELRQESCIRLSSIQASGNTLGAVVLVNRAVSLEESVQKNEVTAKTSKISALEVENKRVIAATSKLESEPETLQPVTSPVAERSNQPAKPAEVPEGMGVTLEFLRSDQNN